MAASTKAENLARARAWAAAHNAEDVDLEAAQNLTMALSSVLSQAHPNTKTMMTALKMLVANFVWNMAPTPKLGEKLLDNFGQDVAHDLTNLYGGEGQAGFDAAVPQLIEDMIDEGYFGGDPSRERSGQAFEGRVAPVA